MDGFSAPIKEGEVHSVKIEDSGKQGDGIARIQGFVVFVPGAAKGEEVQVKITKVMRRFAFAEKM